MAELSPPLAPRVVDPWSSADVSLAHHKDVNVRIYVLGSEDHLGGREDGGTAGN